MTEKLNMEQITFCEYYLKGLLDESGANQTEAYMKAYPDSSKEAACASASRLLTHAKVKEYIAKRMNEIAMTSNETLLRIANLARTSSKDSDKLRALELIGRHQGLFLDRMDVTSQGKSISLADYLNGINQAVQEKNKKKLGGITVLGE